MANCSFCGNTSTNIFFGKDYCTECYSFILEYKTKSDETKRRTTPRKNPLYCVSSRVEAKMLRVKFYGRLKPRSRMNAERLMFNEHRLESADKAALADAKLKGKSDGRILHERIMHVIEDHLDNGYCIIPKQAIVERFGKLPESVKKELKKMKFKGWSHDPFGAPA